MLFHIDAIIRENISPAEALSSRKIVTEQMNVIMKTGKVKESGVYADERGGYFVVDIDTPEELKRLFAPISDIEKITIHPIISMDTLQKLFQDIAK